MANLPMDLQANENVVHIARRHIIYLFLKMFWALIGGVVPLIVLIILTLNAEGSTRSLLLVLTLVWGLGTFLVLYFIWYRYQNDMWIITNQRLIDSKKLHWFDHQMASTDLINVEDMSVDRSGFLPTIFNYGNVNCETAGSSNRFILYGIPDPARVMAIVDELRDNARQQLGYRPGAMGMQ